MSNNVFHFKQFSVQQGNSAMKVSADAVLFGAWISAGNYKRILDIGAGTGLLSLMAATRFKNVVIDAVETDEFACIDAFENVRNAKLEGIIHVFNTDIKKFLPSENYDAIVCNPPFFSSSLPASDIKRNMARHDDSLEPRHIFEFASKYLLPEGNIFLMYPADRLKEIKQTGAEYEFYTERVCYVHKNAASPARLVFTCFKHNAAKTNETTLHMYNDQAEFTNDYKELVSPYYLKIE